MWLDEVKDVLTNLTVVSTSHYIHLANQHIVFKIEPRSPTLQVDSLPAEPQGKPRNTGEGSLSLLQ